LCEVAIDMETSTLNRTTTILQMDINRRRQHTLNKRTTRQETVVTTMADIITQMEDTVMVTAAMGMVTTLRTSMK